VYVGSNFSVHVDRVQLLKTFQNSDEISNGERNCESLGEEKAEVNTTPARQYYAMKTYRGVEVKLHTFLTLAPFEIGWLGAISRLFPPADKIPTHTA
jgi:hypothetical protein